MKQLIYKIIAIASVLLSGLGPQVASGQAQPIQPAAPDRDSQVVLEIGSAVSAIGTMTNVSVQQDITTCDNSAGSVSIMLWQGCGILNISQMNPDYTLAVLAEPANLPEVALQTNQDSLGMVPILSANNNGADLGIIPIAGLRAQKELIQQSVANHSLMEGFQYISFISPRDKSLMVMRC